MTAATPITTPRSVNTLRNLCAHKLEVAIATASEKFIDRFAVVPDKDRFAVVPDKDRFAVVPDKDRFAVVPDIAGFSIAAEEACSVDELDSMLFAGRELDGR
jgi:hypothetical protein